MYVIVMVLGLARVGLSKDRNLLRPSLVSGSKQGVHTIIH